MSKEMVNCTDRFFKVDWFTLNELIRLSGVGLSIDEFEEITKPKIEEPLSKRIDKDLKALLSTICIDFDGVIHPYTKGWTGLIPDDEPPTIGIVEELIKLKELAYNIVIFTTRAQTVIGTNYVKEYLDKYNIPYDSITSVKVGALAYVDDRAFLFNGYSEGLAKRIQNFIKAKSLKIIY